MRDLTGFRKGAVRIRVQGEQTERFLNLCKAREIKISKLARTGEQSLEGNMLIADFFRLSPICRKTGVKIHIPSFFTKVKRERLFLSESLPALCFYWGYRGVYGKLMYQEMHGTVRRRYWIFLRRKALCMGCSGARSAAVPLLRQSGKIIMILPGCRPE